MVCHPYMICHSLGGAETLPFALFASALLAHIRCGKLYNISYLTLNIFSQFAPYAQSHNSLLSGREMERSGKLAFFSRLSSRTIWLLGGRQSVGSQTIIIVIYQHCITIISIIKNYCLPINQFFKMSARCRMHPYF